MKKIAEEGTLTTKDVIFYSSVLKNPVLIQAIGLCPVVAIATSLQTAALLALITMIVLVATEVIASALLKKIPRWLRVMIYVLIGVALVTPIMFVLERYADTYMTSLGIYLPLLAVNSLVVLQCENVAMKTTVGKSFVDAVASSVGYGIVLIIAGAIREFLGNGTIWGTPVAQEFAAKGLLMPFGGFLIIGFMAAALKWFFSKRYPDYAEQLETNSRVTIEKRKPPRKTRAGGRRARIAKNLPGQDTANDDEFYVANLKTTVKTVATVVEIQEVAEEKTTDSKPEKQEGEEK